jgi:hypothetical protein
MSQTLHLELTDDAGPLDRLAATLREVASRLGLLAAAVDTPDPADTTLTLTSGLWVSVAAPFVSGVDPFVADFGMRRAATTDLQIDPTRDLAAQYDELLQVAFGLLAAVPGDAVLHYEYAEVWLVRRSGHLVLNEHGGMWPPDRLARIPTPYESAPLAFATM